MKSSFTKINPARQSRKSQKSNNQIPSLSPNVLVGDKFQTSKLKNQTHRFFCFKAKQACRTVMLISVFVFACLGASCNGTTGDGSTQAQASQDSQAKILNAGFVCVKGVYNSELMAPYDVLQHTFYRDSTDYIRCFIVTPDGLPFLTFEGIRITPDYSFDNVPKIDILIIPSTETSMGADLENDKLLAWLKESVKTASHVITVCDGAFPLAATGALDGRVATTFPSDRDRLAKRFPKVDVRYDMNFVADGKFITSVGGALSYEPAFYLVEKLYSGEHAQRTAKGLVWDWDLGKVAHLVVGSD
ncbi:MAG: DJ-1/PfpI family protein [bacterium]